MTERRLQSADGKLAGIRSEEEVKALISQGRGDPSFNPTFLALLDEHHLIYLGANPSAVIRMRGALLAALAYRALPDQALPIVLAELDSSYDPWLTAIAAAALRKRPEPSSQFVEPLLEAIIYIRNRDDRVFIGDDGNIATTAMEQILQTLGWLGFAGQQALPALQELLGTVSSGSLRSQVLKTINSIQSSPQTISVDDRKPESTLKLLSKPCPESIRQLKMQDHNGHSLQFSDFFLGKPTLVVFFFSRCGNPAKCPMTISRLGRLQKQILKTCCPLRTAAITYDPEYDDPSRLYQYARSWGAHCDTNHRFFRSLENHQHLRDFFDLAVSFGPSTVNQHQREAALLDEHGAIIGVVKRTRLDTADILEQVETMTT